VLSAQDQERSRIARELHDSTAQTLAALVLQLSAAARDAGDAAGRDRLRELHALAADALEEVRALSHTVYPRVLDDLGLVAALEWLARRARERGRIDTVVRSEIRADGVPPAAAAVLYGVAQEALRNAERHSGATTIVFALSATPAAATLEISDNGDGFDVAEAEERRPGMGLFTMRERVALVDGRITISSEKGQGTQIVATVPVA
jgi:signal transduction histidine kinase